MRKPDITIGDNYLERWFVIPRNKYFNIYLHKFSGSDDDRALHDHPWWSVSFLLKGSLSEVFKTKLGNIDIRHPKRFIPILRAATAAHRLVLISPVAWTLFITGPKIRSWGFHCPNGWVHWRLFTTEDGRNIERGCGD